MRTGRPRVARQAALAFTLAIVLPACAGTAASPSEAVATPTASQETQAPASPSGEASCREVEHALGTSCIPEDPQRVVTLGGPTPLDYVLALGLPLVGYDGDPVEPHQPHYIDPAQLGDATWVGGFGAPDLEKVAELEPDLIIYNFDNGDYPQVSAIAPTIVLASGYESYRADFLAAAETLGMAEEAEAHLDGLDERIAEVASGLAEKFEGQTVSAFRTADEGTARIFGTEDYVGELLSDLGLTRPDAQQGLNQDIGLEQIGLLDGDVGFVVHGFAINDPDFIAATEATKEQFLADPLWQTLTFVQNDAVYPMDRNVWGSHGILWADAMLEDISAVALGE